MNLLPAPRGRLLVECLRTAQPVERPVSLWGWDGIYPYVGAWRESGPMPGGGFFLQESERGGMKNFLWREFLKSDTAVLLYLAFATLLIHFLANGGYGYFRDEFYYIACGQHLAWGYVDQPPFAALMVFVNGRLLGDSLFALRFLPAVSGALVVLLTGLMARELGGGRFARSLAATAVMVAPLYLAIDNFYSMNCFDLVFWALAAYLVMRILKDDRPRLWLVFGLLAGIGLMNKYSMGFFAFGLVVGLALTPARKYFASRWLWLGGALALAIFLPHILWEIHFGFPSLEFIHNATLYKNAPMSPLAFLGATMLDVHPFTLPIWVAGLYFYLWSEAGKPHRVLGWIYVAVLALLLFTRSKPYYFGPIYFMLFASGALVIESFVRRRSMGWLRPASFALLLAGGLITAPFVLPVLPVETFIRYQNFLGLKPASEERDRPGELPQHYADMFGWENMVATVAEVYDRLSPEEKARCLIYCRNYGEAGAIDFFGKKYGLPKASSGHNSYWFWGPQNPNANLVITVGESREDVEKSFNRVELAGTVVSKYARSFETNLPICVGRDPKMSLREMWPRTRSFI